MPAPWGEQELNVPPGAFRVPPALVAVGDQGTVIGLGNVFPESPGDEHSGEIALLVEDDHQGRGVGTALLRHLIRMAQRMGFTEVVGVVLADNAGMLHLLEATDLHRIREHSWSAGVDPLARRARPARREVTQGRVKWVLSTGGSPRSVG